MLCLALAFGSASARWQEMLATARVDRRTNRTRSARAQLQHLITAKSACNFNILTLSALRLFFHNSTIATNFSSVVNDE